MVAEKQTGTYITEQHIASLPGVSSELPIVSGYINTVCIDSRQCIPGSLFVPLKGEHTDGHFFIVDAITNGASIVLINRRYWESQKQRIQSAAENRRVQFFMVEDTLHTLQQLAASHMRSMETLLTIGVTGSNGKTTTKELISSILSEEKNTIANTGNLNSEIGVCLAAFTVGKDHDIAVFEMGMNRKGEMDILADIARPDIAVITNIGTAHIGLVGSRDAIAAEKKKITSRFTGTQTLFLYEEDPYFPFLSKDIAGKIISYGPKSLPGLQRVEELGLRGADIFWKDMKLRLPLIGRYNALNCMAAISVAEYVGISEESIKRGIEKIRPMFGRSQILEGEITVIQDCYNANAESFATALDFFDSLTWEGRKIVVTGPMKELGDFSEEAHTKLGKRLADSTIDYVFFFGEETKAAKDSFHTTVTEEKAFWSTDFGELERAIHSYVQTGDIVLLKGSRAAALERIGSVLSQRQGDQPC
jgi:UDP-N-acetylmuramoyl-tripeptide--D-alanyl-D-alanine ligase